MASALTDDFNRANGPTLGTDWASSDFEVSSNRAVLTVSGATIHYERFRHVTPLSSADHSVSAQMNAGALANGSNARPGLILRGASTSYAFATLNCGNGRVTFAKVVSGAYTALDTNVFNGALSSNTEYKLTLTADGATFTVDIDDGDHTETYTINDAALQTGLEVGIAGQSRYNSVCSVDDFEASILGGAAWDGSFLRLPSGNKARIRTASGAKASIRTASGARF